MTSILRKLQWSLQHRGLSGTMKALVSSLVRKQSPIPPHPFDQQHGTDTAGLITGPSLASGHPSDRFIEGYAAVPPSRFRNIMARWQTSQPPRDLAQYTFVDLGCGKGRAILLASELPFRECIGVELNPALATIAKTNAALWIAAGKAHSPIRIEQQDAATFAWPDSPCVVFLFNPFHAPLMQRVVERMAAHFHDRPADLEVLYYNPRQAFAFAPLFETIWQEQVPCSPEDLAADPAASPADTTEAYRLRKQLS